jgi:hypothetical protein
MDATPLTNQEVYNELTARVIVAEKERNRVRVPQYVLIFTKQNIES